MPIGDTKNSQRDGAEQLLGHTGVGPDCYGVSHQVVKRPHPRFDGITTAGSVAG